jgi:hypothetical protein
MAHTHKNSNEKTNKLQGSNFIKKVNCKLSGWQRAKNASVIM